MQRSHSGESDLIPLKSIETAFVSSSSCHVRVQCSRFDLQSIHANAILKDLLMSAALISCDGHAGDHAASESARHLAGSLHSWRGAAQACGHGAVLAPFTQPQEAHQRRLLAPCCEMTTPLVIASQNCIPDIICSARYELLCPLVLMLRSNFRQPLECAVRLLVSSLLNILDPVKNS